MGAPTIPQPIVGAREGRVPVATQLLMALAQSLIQGGAQYGMDKLAPPSVPQQALQGQQAGALGGMATMAAQPGIMQQPASQALAGMGLGNANVDTSNIMQAAPTRYNTLAAQADNAAQQQAAMDRQNAGDAATTARELALQSAKEANDKALVDQRHTLFMNDVKKNAPGHEALAEMLWNSSGGTGNVDATALVQAGVLPQSASQILQDSMTRANLTAKNLEIRKAQADESLRKQVADKLGLPTVTDEFLNSALKAQSPDELSQKLFLEYTSPRTQYDANGFPTTVAPMPMDQAINLTEAGVGQYFPGYKMPDTTKQIVQATGMLEQAIPGYIKQGKSLAETKSALQAAWTQQNLPTDMPATPAIPGQKPAAPQPKNKAFADAFEKAFSEARQAAAIRGYVLK